MSWNTYNSNGARKDASVQLPTTLTLLNSNTWGSVGWSGSQNMVSFTMPRDGVVVIDKGETSLPLSFVATNTLYGNYYYDIFVRTGSYAGSSIYQYRTYSSGVYENTSNASFGVANMHRMVSLSAGTYYLTVTATLWTGNANHFGVGVVTTGVWMIE